MGTRQILVVNIHNLLFNSLFVVLEKIFCFLAVVLVEAPASSMSVVLLRSFILFGCDCRIWRFLLHLRSFQCHLESVHLEGEGASARATARKRQDALLLLANQVASLTHQVNQMQSNVGVTRRKPKKKPTASSGDSSHSRPLYNGLWKAFEQWEAAGHGGPASVCFGVPPQHFGGEAGHKQPTPRSSLAAISSVETCYEHIWLCDECQQPLSASSKRLLFRKRDRLINEVHAGPPRGRFHTPGIVQALPDIQSKPGAWECASYR